MKQRKQLIALACVLALSLTLVPTALAEGSQRYYTLGQIVGGDPNCEHNILNYEVYKEVVLPTCTEYGYCFWPCQYCEAKRVCGVMPNKGHRYSSEGVCYWCGLSRDGVPADTGDGSSEQPETETNPGTTTDPGGQGGGQSTACDHAWETTTLRRATCGEDGKEYQTCIKCKEKQVLILPKTGQHTFVGREYYPPSEHNDGWRKFYCSECGEMKVETIPWTGSSGSPSESRPGDQTGNQSGGQAENQTGGQAGDQTGSQTPCKTHRWNTSTVQATCREEGKVVRTCTVCGTEEAVRTIPKAAHKWKNSTIQATCREEGKVVQTCAVCGTEQVSKTLPKTAHKWEQKTEPASTASPGRTYRICTVCGQEENLSTLAQKVHTGSGGTEMPKLSQQEIAKLLADAPLALPDNIYEAAPSAKAPYSAGKVKTSALQSAVDRLNALRRIAGLPAVSLDLSLCENGQYGAVVLAATGKLSHTPSRPAGMDESFYKQGYNACKSSNIYSGCILTYAVDGFMDDSDSGNIDRLGHRRWQLNPMMGKVGFGCAGGYCTEKVFDSSGAGCAYDYVSWPASGNFPTELFSSHQAWSISLNPKEYEAPSASAVTVTLSGGGRSWTFGSGDRSSTGKYFNVDTAGYGVGNCIIFRPDGVSSYSGTYTVRVDGLRAKGGAAASLEYTVEFFGAESGSSAARQDAQQTAQQTGQINPDSGDTPFTDVPAGSYYHDAVNWALKQGVTTGVTDARFEPNSTCTRGQVVTFLWRANGKPAASGAGSLAAAYSGRYYTEAVAWADAAGLLDGTGAAFNPSNRSPRADIVTYLYRDLAG